MKTSVLILFVVAALACGGSKNSAKSDHAKLQGTWLALTESLNGVKKDVSFVYIFKGDKFIFIDETGKQIIYSFTLDVADNLKYIVVQPEEPNSVPVSVAYELDGDSLKIVIPPPGSRPTEISDRNNQELIVCKRKGS